MLREISDVTLEAAQFVGSTVDVAREEVAVDMPYIRHAHPIIHIHVCYVLYSGSSCMLQARSKAGQSNLHRSVHGNTHIIAACRG